MSDVESISDATGGHAEAVETCDNLDSEDAQESTSDEEFSKASDSLLKVEQVVDELRALAREFEVADKDEYISGDSRFPYRFRFRIEELLSEKGLEELSGGKREETRLRLLEASGLCLRSLEDVLFPDFFDVRFSTSELEALYRPLESSTTLKCLYVGDKQPMYKESNLNPESWQLLADILYGVKALESFECSSSLLLSQLSHLSTAVAAIGGGPLPIQTLRLPYKTQGSTTNFNQEWARTVATLIRAAPRLKCLTLRIYGASGGFADEDGAQVIGEAVASHQSLEILVFEISADDYYGYYHQGTGARNTAAECSKRSFFGRITSRALLGHPRNASVHSLRLDFRHSVSAALTTNLHGLSEVLQTCITLKELTVAWRELPLARDMHNFIKNLQGSVHLQSLTLYFPPNYSADSDAEIENLGFDYLVTFAELLKSNSMQSLKHLSLAFYFESCESTFDWPSFYAALGQNSTIESVEVEGYAGYQRAGKEVLEWIQNTTALHTLTIPQWRKVNWGSIFRCLRGNSHLRSLTANGKSLEDDDAYWELMAMLHVNSTLQEVEFQKPIRKEERAAAVREALRSKARQESYLVELRKGLGQIQAKWQSPKCGRIFLCGSPEAGKTRLTRTMLKLAKGKSRMKKLKEKVLGRTKGIEIHTLRNDKDMLIFVWDLAGQDIFRSIQQFLFPRLSRASVFLFVFSPYDPTHKERRTGVDMAFEKEFSQWLKFIASNSAIIGLSLPQVMVVISHKDKYDHNEVDLLLNWSKKSLAGFIKDYMDVIHIHPDPYFIDGRAPEHAKPIVENVYKNFDQLFQQKLFKVPPACSQMIQELIRWVSKNPKVPVINEKDFFSLCERIPDLRDFSQKNRDDDNRRLLKAVGSYLHDVGTVVDMSNDDNEECEKPKCDLMVVSPHWLTHVFLGRFISFGHGFQLAPGEVIKWAEPVDGFLCEADFQHFLYSHMLKPMKKQFPKLTFSILQDLLENLDLLHVIETDDQTGGKNSRYFIPTLFNAESVRDLQWPKSVFPEKTKDSDLCFLGVRLRCKDAQRTYLSPAFFSRFQVIIWRKFKENAHVECKFKLILVMKDGFDIFIENDEDGDFIDVMVRSTKSRRTVWNYVEKYIVDELREFCASRKGSPGVELVMHILRTECVKRITLCKHRRKQSVSKEDLKSNLMNSIEKLGTDSEENDLFSHTWMGAPEASLGVAYEEASELLPPDDVDEVHTYIKGKTMLLQKKVVTLNTVMNEFDHDSHVPKLNPGGDQTNFLLETKMSESRSEQWISPNQERLERLMQGYHEDLKGDVNKVLAEVRDLKREIRTMKRLQQEEAESLIQIHNQLDQLIGNSVSRTQWPKRPYFTGKDVSMSHKIIAVVDIGKPLMLHFECEERNGHHIVPEQPGYGITVGKENCGALRQIAQSSVQVMCYLLKAGLHITTSLGDLVPQVQTSDGQFTSLTSTSIVRLLNTVRVQDGRSRKQAGESCSPEVAWTFLQDFLKRELDNRITELFLLHHAQYIDRQYSGWLCESCFDRGLKNVCLKKV